MPVRIVGRAALPSNRLTVQLNKNWRIADDPLQWILQRRKGNPRKGTPVGKIDPFARRERDCCGAFANIAATPIAKLLQSSLRSRISIQKCAA